MPKLQWLEVKNTFHSGCQSDAETEREEGKQLEFEAMTSEPHKHDSWPESFHTVLSQSSG